jgi:DMSO/TMAO reductase YedYZ molybdopterin-dependent catalytic subunit
MRATKIRPRHILAIAGLFLACSFPLRGAEARLLISYAGKTTVMEEADLAGLPHQEVTAFDGHDKKDHSFVGIPVRDLLARAGVEFGEKLRGKGLRQVVIAHCSDHYDIVFALAEFDDEFNTRTILLADRQDGQALTDAVGPLRLVVPGDKRPARWAHRVTSLEVLPVTGTADTK